MNVKLLMPIGLLMAVLAAWLLTAGRNETCDPKVNVVGLLNPNQMSAELLKDFVKAQACREQNTTPPGTPSVAELKLILVYDLYIKARSYGVLNKIFFWTSMASAFCVFIWPSLGVLLSAKLGNQEWFKSAIVQTTITGIAAMMFALYSQYKDKQTYTENLMRYAVFSDQPIERLSEKVIEELQKIDKGFSFSSITQQNGGD